MSRLPPRTRETELLNPTNLVMRMHAVLLTGGSTFGLTAAGGVQRWLAEHDVGYQAATGVVVPIVPTARSAASMRSASGPSACSKALAMAEGTPGAATRLASAT